MKNQNINTSDRKLAAILFADIVGYTSLMQTNEKEGLSKLNRFKSVLENKVPEFRGKIANFYGDGCLAVFDSSVDATNCAKELQVAFKEEIIVPVRIGLHSGGVVFKEGNAFGDAVNIASRVESLGIPGAVLLSSSVRNQIKNQPEFQLESLGRFEFKNVKEGMTVYALANEGFPIPKREEIQGKLKTTSQEISGSFFQKIWKKKIPQILITYILLAWLGLQVFDWALNQFGISPYWAQIFFISVMGIIPSLLVYLNNRERIHSSHLKLGEKILFPSNLLAVGSALYFMFGSADLGATSTNVTFTNPDGTQETRNVIKQEFKLWVPLFSFEQLEGDTTNAWISLLIPEALEADLFLDRYILPHLITSGLTSVADKRTMMDKIKRTEYYNCDYFVDGTYRVSNNGYEITPTLRNKKNGKLFKQNTFRGRDILALIDSASYFIRTQVGLTPEQIAESNDYDIVEYGTDNLEALKLLVDARFSRNKFINLDLALELDSNFTMLNYIKAKELFSSSRGKLEAQAVIAKAMRDRKKLPFDFEMIILIYHHIINEDWVKAEELIKMYLEIAPNNSTMRGMLSYAYREQGKLDEYIKYNETLKKEFPNLNYDSNILFAKQLKGDLEEAEKLCQALIKKFPKSTSPIFNLAETYILQGEYEKAKKNYDKILLKNPDFELGVSNAQKVIDYNESHPVNLQSLSEFEGRFRRYYDEYYIDLKILNDQIFYKGVNQRGGFYYSFGENKLLRGNGTNAVLLEFKKTDQGKVSHFILNTINKDTTYHNYYYKQDSSIWKAEELLRKGDYNNALAAYDVAIENYPDHFYLKLAKQHLEYMTSQSEEEILKLYEKYAGRYGEVRIWIENNQLLYKRPGVPRRVLYPISDHRFMNQLHYGFIYEFIDKNNEAAALHGFFYIHETEEWVEGVAPNFGYFEKTELKD